MYQISRKNLNLSLYCFTRHQISGVLTDSQVNGNIDGGERKSGSKKMKEKEKEKGKSVNSVSTLIVGKIMHGSH